MNRLFNLNSPFWKMMDRIFDSFILNILWLIFCLPIITIGPATTAFYYAMFGVVQEDGGYITHDFMRSLKRNLKQGLQLGLSLTLLGSFLGLDIYLCYHSGRGIYSFFLFFFLIIFLLWMAVSIYVFFILAKFERTNKEILIWAFAFSIKNLPRTLYLMFLIVFGIWIIHLVPGLVLIVPGIIAEHHCVVLTKIFKPYMSASYEIEETGEKEGEGKEDHIHE